MAAQEVDLVSIVVNCKLESAGRDAFLAPRPTVGDGGKLGIREHAYYGAPPLPHFQMLYFVDVHSEP